ncbi:Lrp/AsnC family transcriptional regulator [Cryptosporangium sp. NPDC048952]|uniref:Lrp/AsnC family transcriptional regulator n=1 Tax=Cryptosporangium sp. NPDC048952 TaxID=3363961 RepID=UPI0037119749
MTSPPAPLEDDVDRTLVSLLAADGRATLSALAAAAGMSVSATQSRVRRLEQRGVIRGYAADVDPDALGLPLAAFVSITPLDPAQPDDAPEQLSALDAVEACYSVAGDASYLLLVRVPSPRALEELLREIRLVANVRTRTTVVLQTFYERRPHQ